jgi:TATA-binding protein-associated factor
LTGTLALEALHKQVLPFLLRRLKEDVLDDLPPKIIQDYYCDLSALQRDLYESYTEGQLSDNDSMMKVDGEKAAETHVFQTLQYLRKLVNHPTLVLNDSEVHARILRKHGLNGQQNLADIRYAPKLLALQ